MTPGAEVTRPDTAGYDQAWEGVLRSRERGRLAHAYLIAGAPRGAALRLAESMIQILYCTADSPPCGVCSPCVRVAELAHPDVHRVEPKSKSRQIRVEDLREQVLTPISRTAYEGGWKAGLILSAECLHPAAQNKFLKTLEEPPDNTLLILIAERPGALLSTIRSRCQLLKPSGGGCVEADPRAASLADLLEAYPPSNPLEAEGLASRVCDLLDEAAAEAEAEVEREIGAEGEEPDRKEVEARIRTRTIEARNAVLAELISWVRDLWTLTVAGDCACLHFGGRREALARGASRLTPSTALHHLRTLERMSERLARLARRDRLIFEHTMRELSGGG
ncbi:hypothetical protein [Kiritimatiella glycovorans]|uniref:DNA polymerase III subunit tau n=1 Tax=Kiritimatiella glycovorans TaxID=1307763 RepID=A0A0G3EIP5_9BACT|nr:hypothetical protein [Kiritimatiella glycovorans]AKJ64695.1 DNA polymerase III subunit tau [Kiritimatiella glycovorans]